MNFDRTLVQIRERSFPEVLDLALVVIRRRPAAVGLAALAGAAPFVALNAWLMSAPDFPAGLLIPMLALEMPWATAPLTIVLGGLMFGEPPRPGRVLRAYWRGLASMIVLQGLLRAVLVGSGVFFLLVPTRLSFLNEVILLERGRWWGAVRRSASLSGLRGGELFGQWLALLFFGTTFVLCFWVGTGAALNALTTDELTWDAPGWADMLGLRFQLGVWLAAMFLGVARFLTYTDQRIRMEGWEVELRLRAVGRAIEEAVRW